MVSSIPSSLPRQLITDHVLAQLKANQEFPVGDMASPDEAHGWGVEEPNAKNKEFTPYLSLTPGPTRRIEGGLSDSSTEYECNYAVVLNGISRAQTENLADRLRRNLHALERVSLEFTPNPDFPLVVEHWKITQYRCILIGGMQRVRGAFPDYYTETDSYLVRVSKER